MDVYLERHVKRISEKTSAYLHAVNPQTYIYYDDITYVTSNYDMLRLTISFEKRCPLTPGVE